MLTLTAADPAIGTTVRRIVAKRSVATLATTSAAGRPHAATVLYALAEGRLYVSTHRASRKARNVEETGRVALTIAAPRLPVGPPSTVQLQATASVVDVDDPEIARLAAAGAIDRVTGHGELELHGGCFIVVDLPRRVPVYGLGMSLVTFLREPLAADRVARVDWS